MAWSKIPNNLAQPLSDLSDEQKSALTDELGRRALTGIYRQLLLSVITELWVEYLTQMESLRISVGLEAYAQRDPLVQYKSRAAELYQNLQRDIRMGVVTRMFTYRPRDLSQVQVAVGRPEAPALESSADEEVTPDQEIETQAETASERANEPAQADRSSGGKKRKRHRRIM